MTRALMQLNRASEIARKEGIKPFLRKASHYLIVRIVWGFKNLLASLISPFLRDRELCNLNLFEQKIYSQNGEDGILKTIFYKIGTTNKFCVEFGVGGGGECNTRYLIEKQGWNFLQMDSRGKSTSSIKKELITAENVNSIFKKYKVPKQFDLLSIDIDFNDYWVWQAIQGYSPRVVVIEYNASIPPTRSEVVRYDPHARWDGTNYFGASLLALEKLGKAKGYTLVACERRGVNAFFVRDDLIKGHFKVRSASEIYKPPKYGRMVNFKYVGYPPSRKSTISV